MRITREELLNIAENARLSLNESEVERLVSEMDMVISFADRLNEVDTAEAEAKEHITSNVNVFREDEVKPSFDRDLILSNAPSVENGAIKVPHVVDE